MAATLEGKTVIVTGAAGGLGKDIATAYLKAGANVAICDINTTRLQETEAEFSSSFAGRILASNVDVTDEPAITAFVSSVLAKFGRLDILVNNAGLMDAFHAAGTCTRESWELVMGVNVTGSFLATKAAINAFEKNPAALTTTTDDGSPPSGGGGGLIIQIGSVAGERGFEAGLAYTVSKHAVNGLVKHTAAAYGPKGIYAVCLLLGPMPTTNIAEGMKRSGEPQMDMFARTSGAKLTEENFVDTAEVARYCVFLSDRGIAATSNGGLISLRKNFPLA